MSFIECKNLEKTYDNNGLKSKGIENVNFSIEEGSFTVILGPSGSGKTTLLNMLGGMDNITGGTLKIKDIEIEKLNEQELTLFRRNDIGFVFQFYNLMPNLTALENVELASEVKKDALDPKEVLNEVGLSDKMMNFPSQLSGGQQQRVSIARAIAKNPLLLLCDEPTGALDSKTGKQILKLLYDWSHKMKKTCIVVTHNEAIKDMADKVIYIKNGTIEKIIENPNPTNILDIQF